jgi:regulator of protease activity HflC (stomatin/prohibitin superfamily)
MYKLDDQPVLQIGPYTVLTVDEGYAAMTINNGKHIILDGGQMHLLTHQKWKFHSFVNMKIQSDEMMELHVNSADNVTLNVDTMVFWKVTDIKSAAAVLMDEKIPTDLSVDTSTDEETSGMSNLRHKVLKQATAVISRFIGNLNFSNAFNKAANLDDSIQQNELNTGHTDSLKPIRTENPIFEHNLIDDFVSDTRNVTAKFGIEILNIIITAAFPLDQEIASAIHGNVMTTADAMREVTLAKSKASVVKIEADATAASNAIIAESEADVVLKKARAEAEADVLRADGLKKADVLRAEGSRQAGNILESSSVAVNLEAMKTSAMAIKNSDKFFFGKEPNYMPKVVMNFNETETA